MNETTIGQTDARQTVGEQARGWGPIPTADKEHMEKMERRYEANETRQRKLAIFAEVLRARPDLDPEAAADATLKVYAKLA